MKYLLIFTLALFGVGCGLSDELLVFDGQACDSACGPCDLGTWDCKAKSCSVSFEGVADDALCVGEQAQVVFVDVDSTNGDGSRQKPLRTIQEALTRPKARVILLAGALTYSGPIVLTDGVTIEGGWARSWERDTAKRPIIQTSVATDGHTIGVIARALDRTTTLKLLTIQNLDATEGGNIPIFAKDTKDLRLVDLNVIAATGQAGEDGDSGIAGVDGGAGAQGGVGQLWLGGDAGLNPSCVDSEGGNGGNGERRSNNGTQDATRGGISTLGNDQAMFGQDGVIGNAGQPGQDGQDAAGVTLSNDGLWTYASPAEVGLTGALGVGGGGGGGALVDADGTGGGGGGGGAGGCGGTGGKPGTSGWPSVGILAIKSKLSLLRTSIVSGVGGDAGLGGDGGAGGAGGLGGLGAPSMVSGTMGGRGGDGGIGGVGGRGGHGQAGISAGLYCKDSALKEVTNSDIQSGQGGVLASGERALAQDIFQCEMP